MGGKAHQNVSDSSKAEVGEIDTRAPFESVKAAVSLFGETAFSPDKPVVRKPKPPPTERAVAKERQLHLAEKELNKLKEQLSNAETTRVQSLGELEKAKRTVEDLTNKLKIINDSKDSAIKAAETAKIQTKQCEEVETSVNSESGLSWKDQLDALREQYAVFITELDTAKQELRKIKKDFETSMDAKVSAFRQEAEAKKFADASTERAAQLSKEIAAVQESLVHVKVAFLQAQQEESKFLAEKDVSQQSYRHAIEEMEKKLASLKKQFDPELLGNLEAKLAETDAEIGALQKELKNVKLSDLNSVESVATEVDGAKEVLQKVAEEESSIRSLVESMKLELENIKKEHLELKEKDALTESVAVNLQNKLQEGKAELEAANASEIKARPACNDMISTLQQLALDSENARKEVKAMKQSAEELRKEAETDRVTLDMAEKKLQVALREAEEAKAAEANALGQIKVLSEKANAARASTSESGAKITISAEEHKSLSQIVEESETLTEMKVAAALAQVEAVRASEKDAIKKLEATRKEMEELTSATGEALKRAEMAEAARRAVEGEMKRWREREQKRVADTTSRALSESQMPPVPSSWIMVPIANPPETTGENWKSEKTPTMKKVLLPQLSGILRRKWNQVEGGSPSYLPGEKPV